MENLNLNRRQWQALKNTCAHLSRPTISAKHRMRFTANALGGPSAALELAKKFNANERFYIGLIKHSKEIKMLPGYTVEMLKRALTYAKANPNGKIIIGETVTGSFQKEFTGLSWRKWFIDQLHKKINRLERTRVRKDSNNFLHDMKRAQRLLNGRFIIRKLDLPVDLRGRFKHLIYNDDDF